MKVQNIKDVNKFFEVVDSCKGRVELVTGEGDRLNLKSKLCQYVSLANIFSNGEIPELEIIAYEKEDIDPRNGLLRLFMYMELSQVRNFLNEDREHEFCTSACTHGVQSSGRL